MLAKYVAMNWMDGNGNPAGGTVEGNGIHIIWQNGPLGRTPNRVDPNGAFVETIIDIARQRLEFYQNTKFACDENALAIHALKEALEILHERTARREAAGIEGTHVEEEYCEECEKYVSWHKTVGCVK